MSECEMVAIPRKAMAWRNGRDTGISSTAIWSHMLGWPQDAVWGAGYPLDPADLGRCLRLLELLPEWKPRIPEMAQYGPVWAALAAHWDELEQTMAEEVGIDWSKGQRAPITYRLMRRLEEEARRLVSPQEHTR